MSYRTPNFEEDLQIIGKVGPCVVVLSPDGCVHLYDAPDGATMDQLASGAWRRVATFTIPELDGLAEMANSAFDRLPE